MERVADWQLANPPKYRSTDWRAAAGYPGMLALAQLNPDPKYHDAMMAMGEANGWQFGPKKYFADDYCIGQTYAELYLQHSDPRMIAPMRAQFDNILANPSPNPEDLDSTKPAATNKWSWCDALFMGPPAWVRLWAATGEVAYLNFAIEKWWKTSDYLFDKDEHLYFRDSTFFDRREQNGGKVFWSRGNGWVMAGLARVLTFLPKDHPSRERFVAQFREMAEKLITLQQSDGMWRSSLLDPQSYPLKETSGTGFYCYAFAWGVNEGLLDPARFKPAALKAWRALADCVDSDGKLTHVQPVGMDPKSFDVNNTEVFGVGAFLLAGSEIYRLRGGLTGAKGNKQKPLLSTLKKGHPRLLVDDSTWSVLSTARKSDAKLDRFLIQLEAQARSLLESPPVRYEKKGKRLLSVSRTVVSRVMLWSFEYGLTGDDKFLRGAEQEMLEAAAFPDWNPSHFLDTAEMTAALAIGYDWLYDKLSTKARDAIHQAIVEKGLRNFTPTYSGWQKSANNWNQVCFCGLSLGALALGDEEPELAERVLAAAKANNFNGQKPYAPDGVYPEGPSYWSYGTTYEVILIAALESALGTEWGLAKAPGFTASASFLSQATGPSGRMFNYSDGTENSDLQPALFWFAKRLHNPALLSFQKEKLEPRIAREVGDASGSETARFLPLTALWWGPVESERVKPQPDLPLRWFGRGAQPLVVFRTSWDDPDAMWLALKGGAASLSHGHMDAGSFVLEADGVRWARDLGMQDYYSLEAKGLNLFDMKQTSDRWKVFRLNNRSHNVLTINDQPHRVAGKAGVIRYSDQENGACAVLDLSPVFAGQAAKVTRGFSFSADHVVIRDELEGLKPGDDVRWAMATSADVSIEKQGAVLSQNGKHLRVQFSSSGADDATIEVVPADPPRNDYDAANPNMRLLLMHVKASGAGEAGFSVLLSRGDGVPTCDPLAASRLEEWPAKAVEQP
jgi:rhamnogalacturonyl hydrolase YesR